MQLLLQRKTNKYYLFWACVCRLVIQHAMCVHHIGICGLPGSAIFFTLSHNQYNTWKKLVNIKCVLWFSLKLLSEIFLILRRNEWDRIKNIYWSSCSIPVILVRFYETWIFSIDLQETFPIVECHTGWKLTMYFDTVPILITIFRTIDSIALAH